MALKHYGGSLPSAGPLEWTCPACGHQNAVPLKAGCQQCGQKDGAGARKVDGLSPETHALIEQEAREDAQRVVSAGAVQAFWDWITDQQVDASHAAFGKEAWMAGVAWAQGNREPLPPPLMGGPPLSQVGGTLAEHMDTGATLYQPAPFTLMLQEEIQGIKGWVSPAPEMVTTILAALAFYRDNVLNYGAVPGQLDAQGVTDLVMRLSPEEAGQ